VDDLIDSRNVLKWYGINDYYSGRIVIYIL